MKAKCPSNGLDIDTVDVTHLNHGMRNSGIDPKDRIGLSQGSDRQIGTIIVRITQLYLDAVVTNFTADQACIGLKKKGGLSGPDRLSEPRHTARAIAAHVGAGPIAVVIHHP